MKKEDLDYTRNFNLTVDLDGKVYGFVTWFDCEFSKGTKKITLSTSPYRKSTHWKQTIFYLEKPFKVVKGDELKGKMKVCKAEDNIRELNVTMTYQARNEDEIDQYYRISWEWADYEYTCFVAIWYFNYLAIIINAFMNKNKENSMNSEN